MDWVIAWAIMSTFLIIKSSCFRCNHSRKWFFLTRVLQLQARFPYPERVHLHHDAVLCINHPDVYVCSLELDGALVVEGREGSTITIDGLQIHNEGWEWQSLKEGNSAAEHEKIRCVM